MEKKIFYINSRNRLSGTDSSFNYQLDMPPDNNFDSVVVLQAGIKKSYYLIEIDENTFTLSENSMTTIITIPPGNYTRKSFQTVLQTLLNASSPNLWTYSVSFPTVSSAADTGKYTFTVSGNGGIQPLFIFTSFLYEQMGFNSNSTNPFVTDSLTCTNVINLSLEDTLFLHSDICRNHDDNILQDIYTAGNSTYSSIKFDNYCVEQYAKEISYNKSNVYNFYLTDEDGIFMDLNGQNIVITLMVYKRRSIYNLFKEVLFSLIKPSK